MLSHFIIYDLNDIIILICDLMVSLLRFLIMQFSRAKESVA